MAVLGANARIALSHNAPFASHVVREEELCLHRSIGSESSLGSVSLPGLRRQIGFSNLTIIRIPRPVSPTLSTTVKPEVQGARPRP